MRPRRIVQDAQTSRGSLDRGQGAGQAAPVPLPRVPAIARLARTISMTEYIQAWQCIGCGKIEAPQPCIGVCRDRKILMVAKDEHERVVEELAHARALVQTAIGMLGRVVHSTPRGEQWERSYRALQEQAREAIAELETQAS
ncbi:MAG TPA: hypothetical protein VLB69_01565 [Rudaea sp.]|nr:hypothetical protein [Rudaea sp.]